MQLRVRRDNVKRGEREREQEGEGGTLQHCVGLAVPSPKSMLHFLLVVTLVALRIRTDSRARKITISS